MVNTKSRLVAHGFNQRKEIDVGETSAPTVSGSSAHLLSAIACVISICVFLL